MSRSSLFTAHSGCGSMPLHVSLNSAGRFGGGLFQSGCENGLQEKGLCSVGSVSGGLSSSFLLSFEDNTAGAAGGGVFTTCHTLGVCEQVLTKKKLGLPGGGQMLSFLSNTAKGYGGDIASGPSELVIEKYVTAYTPGQTTFDVSFSLKDTRGQVVVGTKQETISHLIYVLALPGGADCTTFSICERVKLQPTESFLSRGDVVMTSLAQDFDASPLKFCQVGIQNVLIRMFVATSMLLDAPPDQSTLQKSLIITCKKCGPGWSRQEVNGGPSLGMLWTCVRCDVKAYVVDPNVHQCQQCPKGATCSNGLFRPSHPVNSVWNSTSGGIQRIVKCPVGYVLIRDEDQPVLDRCVACAPDTYSVEEAVFGKKLWDRSVENYNQYCHPCPRSRAMCSGGNDIRPLAGCSSCTLMIIFLSRARTSLLSTLPVSLPPRPLLLHEDGRLI